MRAQQHFGHVLRHERDKLARTQRVIADMCELDRSYIADLERGVVNPSLVTILSVAKALELTPGQLMDKVDAAIRGDREYQREQKRPRRGPKNQDDDAQESEL